MQVQEARSGDEERMVTRKQKAEGKATGDSGHAPKKAKNAAEKEKEDGNSENNVKSTEEEEKQGSDKGKADKDDGQSNKKTTEDVKAEFEKFCKSTSEHLTIQQMREILEANGQDASGSDDAVVPRCQDIMFYGPLDNCPICGGVLEVSDSTYYCRGSYSEWSSCIYNTRDPPRTDDQLKLPDSVKDSSVADLLRKHQDARDRPRPSHLPMDKPFNGMTISLLGRLSRTHQYWKSKIEKHGGKVVNSVNEASCVVVSPMERERGGSSKIADALEKGIPVVREAWLSDSNEKKQMTPHDSYDVASDPAVGGRSIPLCRKDTSEEALETLVAELKIFGKRSVHKDLKLEVQCGKILEKDGILYNCAFTSCDCWHWHGVNEYESSGFCILQLISVPGNRVYLYYNKGRIGGEVPGLEERLDGKSDTEERLDEYEDVNDAIKEFARLFELRTGNEFEPWERNKKIQKKKDNLFPLDIDDGIDVRHGGLVLRQLGAAVEHCKLEPRVANFMKILCGQEIYRYAMMEMGLDFPELPLGMLTDFHLKTCEDMILEFAEKLRESSATGMHRDALWSDFNQRVFTLLPSTRPYIIRDFDEIANNVVAAFETIRDINAASRLIGDMTGSTLDDPLFERYKKLGCSISPVEKDTDDYKMISKYLKKTYEPINVGEISYGVSIENVFAVELSGCPSYNEIKKLPNKVLLWYKNLESAAAFTEGILASSLFSSGPGYMFGKAIVCSDAAAEAARYGFTAVDRPEGFLVLAVASLGEEITELTTFPENAKSMEEKKHGVMGLGRKKTDESEHFMWKDGIKVPCGKLIPSEHKNSVLEYNEYAVYNPQQVSIRFLVGVKFEEKNVEYDVEDDGGDDEAAV